MKIYFTASLTGKKFYKKNYEEIIKGIKDLGHRLTTEHVLTEEKEKVLRKTNGELKNFYNKDQGWIRKSDVVIAEISYPSVNVGHEISLALELGKQTIVLYEKDKVPTLLEAINSEKFQLISYDLENLNKVLKTAIEEAKKQVDIRFTLLLPPNIVNFLNKISQKKEIPKSVFIRRLIEKEIKIEK